MNWKECGRKLPMNAVRVLSQHLPAGIEENLRNSGQDSRVFWPRFELSIMTVKALRI
jgi:hypothetical protein